MAEEKQMTFYPPSFSDVPNIDLFTTEMPQRPGAEDLFTVPFEPRGDVGTEQGLDAELDYTQGMTAQQSKRITNRQVLLMVGLGIAVVAAACFVWALPVKDEGLTPAQVVATVPATSPGPGQAQGELRAYGTLPLPQLLAGERPQEALSIGRAEGMYEEQDFFNAYRIFYKLHEGMPDDRQSRAQKAFLLYRLALCRKGEGQLSDAGRILREVVSKTQVPLIVSLGRYHQALAELHDENFFKAAKRARQALALIDVVQGEQVWIQVFKRSCGFIENRAMTLHVLGLHDADHGLPPMLFDAPPVPDPFLGRDDEAFLTLLHSGQDEYDEALLAPRITRVDGSLAVPSWKIVCQGASVGALMRRFAKKSGLDLDWSYDVEAEIERIKLPVRERPIHLYLSGVTDAQAVVAIAGAAGLFATRDANDVVHIADPMDQQSLTEHREDLTQWTISLWRNFIDTAGGETDYLPKAHFAQALLYEQTDQTAAALQEYFQVANRFESSDLAPYGLLNSSMLKTNTADFVGAREDLETLTQQYPDVEFSGNALIYLADATLKAGRPDEAATLYKQVYLRKMSPKSVMEVAFGAALCDSLTHQHENAVRWFGNYFRTTAKKPDEQVTQAYFLLGKAYLELGLYDKAQAALLQALEGDVTGTFYVEALESYVQAQIVLKHYVTALSQLIIEPAFKLSRQDNNRITILKARVFRLVGAFPSAISHLVDGLKYLQEPQERALAYVELATCYELDGQLDLARYRYTEALNVLEPGLEAQRMQYKIAHVTLAMGHAERAFELGDQLLKGELDDSLRPQVLEMLAQAHAQRREFGKAAELMLRRAQWLLPEPNAPQADPVNGGVLAPEVAP
ncbi:MAG: hypothetical protein IH892_13695 [Planctomycetes bacterium]|nr:hypothetical protein [Planctomycetota bacterium]